MQLGTTCGTSCLVSILGGGGTFLWKGIRFISVRFEGGEGTGKATEMGMALGYGAEGGGGQ